MHLKNEFHENGRILRLVLKPRGPRKTGWWLSAVLIFFIRRFVVDLSLGRQ